MCKYLFCASFCQNKNIFDLTHGKERKQILAKTFSSLDIIIDYIKISSLVVFSLVASRSVNCHLIIWTLTPLSDQHAVVVCVVSSKLCAVTRAWTKGRGRKRGCTTNPLSQNQPVCNPNYKQRSLSSNDPPPKLTWSPRELLADAPAWPAEENTMDAPHEADRRSWNQRSKFDRRDRCDTYKANTQLLLCFLLLWHFSRIACHLELLGFRGVSLYVLPERRIVFRRGPLLGRWHAGARLDHSSPLPVDPTEGEIKLLIEGVGGMNIYIYIHTYIYIHLLKCLRCRFCGDTCLVFKDFKIQKITLKSHLFPIKIIWEITSNTISGSNLFWQSRF